MTLSHRTDFPDAASDRSGRTVSQIDSGKQDSPCGSEAQPRRPLECATSAASAPRCDGLAGVVFRSPNTLCHAVKHDRAVQYMSPAGSPGRTRYADLFLNMFTLRYSQVSLRWMTMYMTMMI